MIRRRQSAGGWLNLQKGAKLATFPPRVGAFHRVAAIRRRGCEMAKGRIRKTGIDRRSVLKLAAGAGLSGAAGLRLTSPARAADTTLAIWTGFPECQPFYQAVADAYTKLHPEVKCTVFSTSLREMEQKLSAAVPTGTGPDIYDIGTNITINFIESGLVDPNSAEIDQYLRGGAWNKFVVDFFTIK